MSDLTREEIECLQRGNAPDSIVGVLCTMAIRALDAGWQPMSTAPRDGTPILITTTTIDESGREIVCVGCLREDEHGDDEAVSVEDAYGFPLDEHPVAWMPLPPPCAEVPHE